MLQVRRGGDISSSAMHNTCSSQHQERSACTQPFMTSSMECLLNACDMHASTLVSNLYCNHIHAHWLCLLYRSWDICHACAHLSWASNLSRSFLLGMTDDADVLGVAGREAGAGCPAGGCCCDVAVVVGPVLADLASVMATLTASLSSSDPNMNTRGTASGTRNSGLPLAFCTTVRRSIGRGGVSADARTTYPRGCADQGIAEACTTHLLHLTGGRSAGTRHWAGWAARQHRVRGQGCVQAHRTCRAAAGRMALSAGAWVAGPS